AGLFVVLVKAAPSMLIFVSPVAGVQSAVAARSITPRLTMENGMVTAVAYLTGRVAKTSSPPTSNDGGAGPPVSPKSSSRDTLRLRRTHRAKPRGTPLASVPPTAPDRSP